jgi:hypothetical protein
MTTYTRAAFKIAVDKLNERAQNGLEKFKTDMDANPLHAFEWGDNAVMFAARAHVASVVLNLVEHAKHPVKSALEVSSGEVWRLAGAGGSSSAMRNLMSQAVLAAYADFYDEFKAFSDASEE